MKIYGRFGVNYKDKTADKTAEYAKLRVKHVYEPADNKGLLKTHPLTENKDLTIKFNLNYAKYQRIFLMNKEYLFCLSVKEKLLLRLKIV